MVPYNENKAESDIMFFPFEFSSYKAQYVPKRTVKIENGRFIGLCVKGLESS